jgi:hypothetical protein
LHLLIFFCGNIVSLARTLNYVVMILDMN